MLEINQSFRDVGQPSVAVTALDTVIRSQDALAKAATRDREIERVAEAEQKKLALEAQAIEKSKEYADNNNLEIETNSSTESYSSNGSENEPAQALGANVDIQA